MKKKLFIILFVSILLVSCGKKGINNNNDSEDLSNLKIHENISGEVIDEAKKMISIIDEAIEDNTIPEDDSFDWYIDKYKVELDYVNDEEFETIMAMALLVINLEGYFDESQDYPKDIDRLYETMETGSYQRLTKSNSYYQDYYDKVADSFYHYEEPNGIVSESETGHEEEEKIKEDTDTEEDYDDSQHNVDDIDRGVNDVVNSDLDNTVITDLRINEDLSVDEERYIVLVDLEWDVKNGASTTKEMLDMYSDHLAASLTDNELIYELVLFWTVPYHNENDSILKRAYENKDGGMYLEDEMKDVSVFD